MDNRGQHDDRRAALLAPRLPLLESLHLMAQELSLARLASLVESRVAATVRMCGSMRYFAAILPSFQRMSESTPLLIHACMHARTHCTQLLAAESALELLELAQRLGPKTQSRLGRAVAYFAVLHQVEMGVLGQGEEGRRENGYLCGGADVCAPRNNPRPRKQEVLWPFYHSLPPATFPHKAARLAWLRACIETTAQALEMVQPVAPGSLRPCNADGSYDDDDDDDDEGSLRYVSSCGGGR